MKQYIPHLIFLCGFMGTGKTAVGELLARRLELPFRDLDDIIEQEAGKSIRAIFDEGGEAAFRKTERASLLDTTENFKGVVALGGGALQDWRLTNHIKLNGLLIFIETPISVILQRISADPDRPLLLDEKGKVKDHKILEKELQYLYEQRLPLYRQAQISINSSMFSSADQLAKELIKKIKYHVSHY